MPGSLLAAVRQARSAEAVCASQATLILVCGGAPAREQCAARMACSGTFAENRVEVWVSSGMYRRSSDFDPEDTSNPHSVSMLGVDYSSLRPRLTLDRSAVDTVGNFTTTVSSLVDGGHRHIALVTSSGHMRRARACAMVVLGAHGITFTPIEVAESKEEEGDGGEGWLRTLRDVLRCVMWVLCGLDGETLARWMHPDRF